MSRYQSNRHLPNAGSLQGYSGYALLTAHGVHGSLGYRTRLIWSFYQDCHFLW